MTRNVGPVSLSHDQVREFFEDHGEVVSYRTPYDRSGGPRTTGDTWWNAGRGQTKGGDCHIEILCEASPANPTGEFEEYRPLSSFATVDDWFEAIVDLNSTSSLPTDGHLYRITDGHGDEGGGT